MSFSTKTTANVFFKRLFTGSCSIKHPLVNNYNQSHPWITQTCALVGPRPVDLKLHYIQYRSDFERRREIMDLLRIPRKDKMEIHTLFDTLTNVYVPEGYAFMMDLPTNDYVAPLRGNFLISHIEIGTPLNRGDISDTIDIFREIQANHMKESKQYHASTMVQYINALDQKLS